MYYGNVERMTSVTNEDVKYTSAWYWCIKFTPSPNALIVAVISSFPGGR